MSKTVKGFGTLTPLQLDWAIKLMTDLTQFMLPQGL